MPENETALDGPYVGDDDIPPDQEDPLADKINPSGSALPLRGFLDDAERTVERAEWDVHCHELAVQRCELELAKRRHALYAMRLGIGSMSDESRTALPFDGSMIGELRRSLAALALEVPTDVWDDLYAKADAVLKRHEDLVRAIRLWSEETYDKDIARRMQERLDG